MTPATLLLHILQEVLLVTVNSVLEQNRKLEGMNVQGMNIKV